MLEWGIDPLPTEAIHTPDGKEYKTGNFLYNFTPVVLYGLTRWDSLFNIRQKLVLISLVEKVRQAYYRMVKEGIDNNYAKAIISYLGLAIDRMADKNSVLCRLISQTEAIGFTYSRQALPMLWDYIEMNSLEHPSGWNTIIKEILANLKHFNSFQNTHAIVTQSSATSLPYPDNYFDAVFTDPPYYDNVPYADLSDFFYVWLKRSIGDLFPELFSTPATPKVNEIIAELPLLRGMNKKKAALIIKTIKTKDYFEKMLKKSFQEIYRILKPNGIATIVYAHKSTEGWETLINSLIDSGLIVTASWPINTEMQARLRAKESAALTSSIYIIARKMKRESTGFYNNIKEELKTYLYDKLERLWSEGISGADFFISAIGSAIEIFGKYEKIIDYEGNIIRASQMLSDVRRITTDYAVHQILQNGFAGEISNLTRFYVLYRWSYGEAKLHFDEARKLSTSANVSLEKEWNRPSFIKKEKEFIRVLGPQDRKFEDFRNSSELVDVLHTVLLLWEKGRRNEMITLLEESGYGKSDAFYRVAQTISETLPNESKEKKLLDGFLSGKMRLQEEIKNKTRETRINLFNYKDK